MKLTYAGKVVRFAIACLFLIIISGTRAQDQHPLLDQLANKVIQKYQNSSCQQIAQQKSQPPSPQDVKVVQFLRTDPQLRTEFINKIAGPIANKLFDCGMIP